MCRLCKKYCFFFNTVERSYIDKKESFGGEIAKQVPVKAVYDDVFHPPLTEIGKAVQGATRVALAPISALVWGKLVKKK